MATTFSIGTYTIQSVGTGTVAKGPTAEGASVVGVKPTGNDSEKWIVTPTDLGYTFKNVATKMYAGIIYTFPLHSGSYDLVATANPIYFDIAPATFQEANVNAYQLVLSRDELKRVWDLAGGVSDDGTKLLVYNNYNGANNQKGLNQSWVLIGA